MKFNQGNILKSFAGAVFGLLGLLGGFLNAGSASAASSDDPIYFRLSGRHFNESVASLEAVAGGREQLVTKLLELRLSEGVPWVSIRAEKLLVQIANDEGGTGPASSALEADAADKSKAGLARVIVTNIDSIESDSLKTSLATKAVSSHAGDARMTPYLKLLQSSSSGNVRAAARTVN